MPATPVTSVSLVSGVLARLAAKIQGYAIEAYPDKPESYQLKHGKGAFLVQYRGSDYESIDGAPDAVAQARGALLDVVVLGRSLADAGGAYAMLELARVALVGHKVVGFTKLAMVRDRFVGRTENVWMYALTFAANTLAVELPDDTDVAALLTHITLVGPYRTSEITDA